MAWGKFDDGLDDHPKMIAAGSDAICLWFVSVLYANRQLTDGFIPFKKVRGFNTVSHPLKAARTLVRVGLWEQAPGGYNIHDFHDFNPHAADVKAKREAERLRKEQDRLSARTKVGRPAGQPLDVHADGAICPPASRARVPNPNPNPNPLKNKKREQAATTVRGTQHSDPHPPAASAAVAAARQDSQTTQTDNGNGKANGNGNGHPATTTQAARLVFKGQRFVVFAWMIDGFSKILGPQNLQAFDLPAWYRVLDNRLFTENRVLTADERWPMLQQELKAEVERRGLPMIRAEKPFTHAELTKAARVRKLRFGCPHPETCDGEESCKARLILEWRQDARTEREEAR